jgi:hypothetical protein
MDTRLVVPAKVLVGPLLSALGDGCVECFLHSSSEQGFRHAIKFVANSTGQICGVTDIHLTRPFDVDDDDAALRSCLLYVLVAIVDEYGFVVGDYSFSKIVHSHKMFLKAQSRIDSIYSEFRNTKNAALRFLRCLNEFMVDAQLVVVLREVYDKKSGALASVGTELLKQVTEANEKYSGFMKLGHV